MRSARSSASSTTRLVVLGTMLVVLLLPPALSDAGDREGRGLIACELSTAAGKVTCSQREYASRFPALGAAPRDAVSFTLAWAPVSRDADVLRVTLVGSTACLSQPGARDDCYLSVAQGASPLRVTLRGAAVRDHEVKAFVSAADVCPRESSGRVCEGPYARLVRDQPFAYSWRSAWTSSDAPTRAFEGSP